jgi:hypothetical protein
LVIVIDIPCRTDAECKDNENDNQPIQHFVGTGQGRHGGAPLSFDQKSAHGNADIF